MPTMIGTAGQDQLLITASSTAVIAGDGNDTINGSNLSGLQIRGGLGNDTYNLQGMSNSTIYFSRGDGDEYLSANMFGANNTIEFDASIRPENVKLYYSGGFSSISVRIAIEGGGGSITIGGINALGALMGGAPLPSFKFADGLTISPAYMINKAQTFSQWMFSQGSYLNGTADSDALTGAATADVLMGLAGNDTLLGMAGNDVLIGGEGHDVLDGGTGADFFVGGKGSDSYIVDSEFDLIQEFSNQGLDIVHSSISYTLGSNLERLRLTGHADISGTGNALDNTLTGNIRNNTLRGALGNDLLLGMAGNDTLIGGEGQDTLNGNIGHDRYEFLRGDGQDVIIDSSTVAGEQDQLVFGSAISSEQLWLSQHGQDLVIAVIGTTDQVTIQDWFANPHSRIEHIKSGGKTLSDSNVQNLVDAMAGLTPPALGETSLNPNDSAQLSAVITANWQ